MALIPKHIDVGSDPHCCICKEPTEGDHIAIEHRCCADEPWLAFAFCWDCIVQSDDPNRDIFETTPITEELVGILWERYMDAECRRLGAQLHTRDEDQADDGL